MLTADSYGRMPRMWGSMQQALEADPVFFKLKTDQT